MPESPLSWLAGRPRLPEGALSAVDFYLICFIVGFVLSLVSFAAGAMRASLQHE